MLYVSKCYGIPNAAGIKRLPNLYECLRNDYGFYGFVVKEEDSCSFSIHQNVISSDLHPAATDTHPTAPPSTAGTPAAPPGLIQCTPTIKVSRLYLICVIIVY